MNVQLVVKVLTERLQERPDSDPTEPPIPNANISTQAKTNPIQKIKLNLNLCITLLESNL